MKKKPIKALLKELKVEHADFTATKNDIVNNYTVSEIVDELIDIYTSKPVKEVVNETKEVKITLGEEDYNTLLSVFKKKAKRNRK